MEKIRIKYKGKIKPMTTGNNDIIPMTIEGLEIERYEEKEVKNNGKYTKC